MASEIPISGLPQADLPLHGNETFPFVQDGITVSALLSALFSNIAGVTLIGPLKITNTAGDVVGTLQQNEEIGVGFKSADGHTQFTISNDQNELRAQVGDLLAFLGVLSDSVTTQVVDSSGVDDVSSSFTVRPIDLVLEHVDNLAPQNYAELRVSAQSVSVGFSGDSGKLGGQVALQIGLPGSFRPSPSIVGAGYEFFDTDLAGGNGMPIWSNGTGWVDATGTPV